MRQAFDCLYDADRSPAAILGGPALAATTAAAAIGGIGAVLVLLIQDNAEHLEQQTAEGRLLFVRARDAKYEQRARILAKHSYETRIHAVRSRLDGALP